MAGEYMTTKNISQENSKLHKNLINFGLNPIEWRLIEVEKDFILIQSKLEKEFSLLGKTKYQKGQRDWQEIQLYQL